MPVCWHCGDTGLLGGTKACPHCERGLQMERRRMKHAAPSLPLARPQNPVQRWDAKLRAARSASVGAQDNTWDRSALRSC
jgi:hypothetical protein